MFEIETGLIFWNTVSFAILVLLMYRWVLPPIIAVMKERQKLIEDSVAQAEISRKKSEDLLAESKRKMTDADLAGNRLIMTAKTEGERIKKEMIEKAEKQAGLINEQAKQDLLAEKSRILVEAKQELADLVVLASSRVVGRAINREDNIKMIEEALK